MRVKAKLYSEPKRLAERLSGILPLEHELSFFNSARVGSSQPYSVVKVKANRLQL